MRDNISYGGYKSRNFNKNLDWKEKLSNIELEQKEDARRRTPRVRSDKMFIITYIDGTQKQIVADHWTFLRGSDYILEFRDYYEHWLASVNVHNIACWERVSPIADGEQEEQNGDSV